MKLGIAEDKYWKACGFAVGGFRIDETRQINHGFSAQNGQRLTILIAEAIMRHAEETGWGLRDEASFEGLKEWIKGTKSALEKCQGRILDVVPHQDDLFVVVLGDKAAKDTEVGLRRFDQEEMGVQIGEKEDASSPFRTSFGSIGAA